MILEPSNYATNNHKEKYRLKSMENNILYYLVYSVPIKECPGVQRYVTTV